MKGALQVFGKLDEAAEELRRLANLTAQQLRGSQRQVAISAAKLSQNVAGLVTESARACSCYSVSRYKYNSYHSLVVQF